MERFRNLALIVGLVALLVLGGAVLLGGCAPAEEVEEEEVVDEVEDEEEVEEEEVEEEEVDEDEED